MEGATSPPAAAASGVAAKKPPPLERADAVALRTKVILSFWAVIVVLGLPTWWQTTSIYRAHLPLQDMVHWADGLHTPSAIPLHIWVSAPNVTCAEAQTILRETQHALDDLDEYPILHQRLHLVTAEAAHTDTSKSRVRSQKCGEDPASPHLGHAVLTVVLEPTAGDYEFTLDPVSSSATARVPLHRASNAAKALAADLHGTFTCEQIAAALRLVFLAGQSPHAQAFLKSKPYESVTVVEKQINGAYTPSPEFHLTFSLITASGAPSSWDVQDALVRYIHPLVHALSDVASFEITTQIQLYSSYSPAIRPVARDGQQTALLQQKDLTAFVNAAEWPLAPSIGKGPTVNFILYVPAPGEVPLRIEGIDATSWLVPQWGGIQIFNPPLQQHPDTMGVALPSHLDKHLLEPVFETFASQLLSLLGVLQAEGATTALPLHLRLGAFRRQAAMTMYLRAASSLGSLSRLAQRLGNIPIPRHVAQLVDDTVGNLTACRHALLASNWDDALRHAKAAYADGEKAFFDKSMVGQVYFPDEHKVAVYLPLLGPIGVPLVVGLVREIKRLATNTAIVAHRS